MVVLASPVTAIHPPPPHQDHHMARDIGCPFPLREPQHERTAAVMLRPLPPPAPQSV